MIRRHMATYRRAQEGYYIGTKPTFTVEDGRQAFSLITPPLNSPVTKRRVKFIMKNMLGAKPSADARLFPSGPRTPHVVTVAVTYDCQCRCGHCSAASFGEEMRRRGAALSAAELKDAIAQCVELGATCVILTGGEPLLWPGLFDVIRSIDRRKSICTVFTNGEYLDETAVDRLKRAGAYGVFVSFDSADPTEHDRHRGRPGLFEKAAAGVGWCRAAGLLTGLSTYATRESMADGRLDALMDLGRALGVLEVFVFDAIPVGRLGGCPECAMTGRDSDALRALRNRYNERADYPRVLHQTMFSSIAHPCVAEGCPAGVIQMHLRANGDVSPCDFTPCSFGNIRRRPVADIWRDLTSSPLYAEPSPRCRMSEPDFRTRVAALEASA
jgi:MoaA/NifB/PqqE/SkfB family radical SAM enzyme